MAIRWSLPLGLLGLLLLLTGGGYLLPAQLTVERSLAMQAPPSLIYRLLTHAEDFPDWSPWAQRDPAMAITQEGPDAGEGMTLRWQSEREPDGYYRVEGGEPGAFVVHHLKVGESIQGPGRFEIEPERTRQRVTWSVTLEATNNPFQRYLNYFRQDALGEQMLSGLTYLKVQAEHQRSPFPDDH